MRLVTFKHDGAAGLGSIWHEFVIDLHRAEAYLGQPDRVRLPAGMIELLEQGEAGLAQVRRIMAAIQGDHDPEDLDVLLPLDQVTLLPPVLHPQKVICLGLNYRSHAAEKASEPPGYPMLFHKTAGSLLGAGDAIVIPPITSQVDYEGELAVVMGKTCKAVGREKVLDYVAGYTVANDVSARDLQYRTKQFTSGKMLDTFCPLGPALVTRDEVPDPNNLAIRTTLNGQVMQQANTGEMIFDVPFIVSYISQITTLRPGDVILTGTPEGVGFARTPPVYLKPGDQVTVAIEGLGELTNPVVKAGP